MSEENSNFDLRGEVVNDGEMSRRDFLKGVASTAAATAVAIGASSCSPKADEATPVADVEPDVPVKNEDPQRVIRREAAENSFMILVEKDPETVVYKPYWNAENSEDYQELRVAYPKALLPGDMLERPDLKTYVMKYPPNPDFRETGLLHKHPEGAEKWSAGEVVWSHLYRVPESSYGKEISVRPYANDPGTELRTTPLDELTVLVPVMTNMSGCSIHEPDESLLRKNEQGAWYYAGMPDSPIDINPDNIHGNTNGYWGWAVCREEPDPIGGNDLKFLGFYTEGKIKASKEILPSEVLSSIPESGY